MHNQHITVLAKNYMVSLHGEFISDRLFLPLTPLNAVTTILNRANLNRVLMCVITLMNQENIKTLPNPINRVNQTE